MFKIYLSTITLAPTKVSGAFNECFVCMYMYLQSAAVFVVEEEEKKRKERLSNVFGLAWLESLDPDLFVLLEPICG